MISAHAPVLTATNSLQRLQGECKENGKINFTTVAYDISPRALFRRHDAGSV